MFKNTNEVDIDVNNMSSALSTAYDEFIGTMPHGKSSNSKRN